jgi:hypothetical protein
VTAAALHMVDKAAHWFQSYKQSRGSYAWENFVIAVSREFELNTHHIKTMQLLSLRQTGSVSDYRHQFDQLIYHIHLYDSSISETMMVAQFLMGLWDDLRQSVEMYLPTSVSQAATLASIHEHLNEKSKPHVRKFTAPKTENKDGPSTDLWKARQLKEFRRANNLCFKCGDKYFPGHTCAVTTCALNVMETTVDGGEFLSDEMLNSLEGPQFCMTQGEGFLSLNALSGQPRNKAIQLRALVKNQSLVILVDSGSSHTFLNARISDKLQVRATTIPSLSVRVVNDEMLRCDAEVKNFEWWCQGNTFQVDAKIIDIGAYDLVLDMDWLEQFRPMMCDWLEKWIQFQYKGSIVRLQGIVPSLEQELKYPWNNCLNGTRAMTYGPLF